MLGLLYLFLNDLQQQTINVGFPDIINVDIYIPELNHQTHN